jgi:outer membrane protein OmpA-like peptidoglycan-associated protein/outer membrane protein W
MKLNRSGIVRVLLAAFFMLLTGAAPLALAQSDSAPVAFDIPAQSMAGALNAWAVQANLQVFFEQAPVAGLQAPAVSGTLPPTQALRALLAHTPLEYLRNPEGAYVVRPRAARAAAVPAKAAAPLAATPAAAAPVPVAAAPRSVRDSEGPWVLRLRGNYLDPRSRSDALSLPTVPALAVPADGTRSNGAWGAELGAEYFFNSHWSGELALNLPQVHDLTLHGTASSDGKVGSFRLMPNYLTLKYNFNPEGVWRPYAGLGLNVTHFYDQALGPLSLSRTIGGPAAQLGMDVRLTEHLSLNADVKWARLRPAIAYADAPQGQLRLDPMLYGIGIAYRFGGSPPPPPPALPLVAAAQPELDSDGDGVPDSRDKCPNTPHGVAVDADGCPLDSDGDGVPDYLDKCPGTPRGLKVDAEGCEVEELVLRGVNFRTNSAELLPESWPVLDSVVAVLVQRPNDKAQVHGYTDSRGADAYNLKLSQRRAAAVADYLASHGVARQALSAEGFGKASPVASNDTAEGRAANRRVTVQFSRPVPR